MWAHIRDAYRTRVITMKADRRVIIGPTLELVFDNRFTLTMQIEEICRLENLTRDEQIAEEIATTNQLMPTADSLAATLFIPLPQDDQLKDKLAALVGIDEHIVLHLGAISLRAAFEPGRSTQDKISAVQYLRFPLNSDAHRALATPSTKIVVEVDHPNYKYRIECPDALRASLAADYV